MIRARRKPRELELTLSNPVDGAGLISDSLACGQREPTVEGSMGEWLTAVTMGRNAKA